MAKDAPEQYGSAEIPPMTGQEKVVLQAIYDHFREHGAWPTFITIDRPIRREHRWDTGAIILSLPESLIVQPRPGNLRPIASDGLRLRLLGVKACDGSSDDTERFVRTLHWLAGREEAYEPPAGSGDESPQVTSQEIADYLGLDHTGQLPLQRLYAMLQLDHWGLGGSGSNDDSWYVRLGQDVWRFRDVRSVEDPVGLATVQSPPRASTTGDSLPATARMSPTSSSPDDPAVPAWKRTSKNDCPCPRRSVRLMRMRRSSRQSEPRMGRASSTSPSSSPWSANSTTTMPAITPTRPMHCCVPSWTHPAHPRSTALRRGRQQLPLAADRQEVHEATDGLPRSRG